MDWLEIIGWEQEEIDDLRSAGYSYLRQGVYDTALNFFEALSVMSPTPYDLETLGAIHLQIGNGMQALDYIDRTLQIEPENLTAKLNRAKALFMLGYRRQGLLQALELEKCEDPKIASLAAALVLAYK